MRNEVRVCVLKTDGINCDNETSHAFGVAGARASIVHINSFRSGADRFGNYDVLVVPGGFSYGDDIVSGEVLGNELVSYFRDELGEFVRNPRKRVLGICNGFQVLVRAGLLPTLHLGVKQATLALNTVGHFRCRWVRLRVEQSPCDFTKTLAVGTVFELPIAHGEGNLQVSQEVLDYIERERLVAFRYVSNTNPNGSVNDIAGLCNKAGNVLGLMPHPERFVRQTDHPNWRRGYIEPLGLAIFESAVKSLQS